MGFRNVLVHGYVEINVSMGIIIFREVVDALPAVLSGLRSVVGNDPRALTWVLMFHVAPSWSMALNTYSSLLLRLGPVPVRILIKDHNYPTPPTTFLARMTDN